MSLFLATDLPRNLFVDAPGARGYIAGLVRSNAANDGAAFVFYNPPAAALTSRQLLLVTKLAVATDDEPMGITVEWSNDVAALDALTGVLAATNHIPAYLDGTTDATTKVAIEEENALAVTIGATFCREQTAAAAPGLLLPIEYPVVMPPGNALIVRFNDRSNTSTSRLNVSWFRA